MLIYILSLSIAAVALIVMGVILARHWKQIRLVDPETIVEERERRKRDELLMQRFNRLRDEKVTPLRTLGRRAVLATKTKFHGAYLKLLAIEKQYQKAAAPFAVVSPSVRDRVKLLLNDARSLARDLKWADAERRYLEVLNIDPRQWDAYKGLGQIYLKQDLLPQAKETFEFLLKSKKADDICYAALAEIAERGGDEARAEDMRRRAVELHPRLPNRQAELAEFYLKRNEPAKAWPPAKRAADLDAKSARYLEISLEAAMLLGDRMEARKRYDKLRVLSQDRPKLDAYKEKLEKMDPKPTP